MANQLVKDYTNQGLNRLAKEKLVTIISNLQNMPTELAMKVSENIPAFFTTCDDALRSTDAIYREEVDRILQEAQSMIDILKDDREYYKQCLDSAESSEEKEKYNQEINRIDTKISSIQSKARADRNALIKDRGKFYLMVLSLMGASVGIAIKVGKRFQ